MNAPPLLRLKGLTRHHQVGTWRAPRAVHALDDVTLDVLAGETLGLVGESGCGKSTLGRCALRLEDATAGRIVFDGRDITDLPEKHLRPLRRDMQMVFQDPISSLNPSKRVRRIIGDVLKVHGEVGVERRVAELLERVGLLPQHADRFPHEFSGGQRQRIGVARALALRPRLIVLDEPVSALDVSVQAQVVNLLDDLQGELGLTYLFIAHDLGVVRHVSDRIGVLHLGHLVELAGADDFYAQPLHPYSEALLSAVPEPDPGAGRLRDRIVLNGGPPSAIDPGPGCRFAGRCAHATAVCRAQAPPLQEVIPGRLVACHHPRRAGLETAATAAA